MRTNYSIPSRDIFSIPPWDLSNITEYSYESTPYKSTPTNSKVHLVDSDSLTSDPSTNPTTPTKLSNSKILQHTWSRIFNYKQYLKYLKRYDGNENHWLKAKENWAAAISAAQCNFILNSDYIPPDKPKNHECNSFDLDDGYILYILYLNIPTSDSHQCRNALEPFCKRDPNVEGFITDGFRV